LHFNLRYKLRCRITKFYEPGKNMCHTLLGRLFVSLNHQFRMLRFFIWVIDAGKALEFSLVNTFVEILDISLTAHLDGTLDVYLNKIADLFACPFASFTVRGDSGTSCSA